LNIFKYVPLNLIKIKNELTSTDTFFKVLKLTLDVLFELYYYNNNVFKSYFECRSLYYYIINGIENNRC